MSQTAYVNGAYTALRSAAVSIFDRGFQFSDAVYEVWAVRGGRLFEHQAHMARLARSLAQLQIAAPMSDAALTAILRETLRRNRVVDGIVYLQISRGAAARDHAFPDPPVRPSVIVTAKNLDRAVFAARAAVGVKVISTPETRWARRDIKSVSLLANVLARQRAKEQGAFEAWFVDGEGLVTEGTSSNAWIVDADGALRTRPLSADILHGVTRASLMRIAQARRMRVVETAFTIAEALAAREAFISSTGNPAVPVIAIDGAPVGDGRPGPICQSLRAAYLSGGSAL